MNVTVECIFLDFNQSKSSLLAFLGACLSQIAAAIGHLLKVHCTSIIGLVHESFEVPSLAL